MDDKNKEDKHKAPTKRIKLTKPTRGMVNLNPQEKLARPDGLYHESSNKDVKKLILEKKADGRKPEVKSIIKKPYPNTGGEHPLIARVRKQAVELNKGKKTGKVQIKPLSNLHIASPFRTPGLLKNSEDIDMNNKDVLSESLDVLKQVIAERSTTGFVTSGWNRARKGHTRPMKPSHHPDRTIVTAIKHAKRSEDAAAKTKMQDRKAKQQQSEISAERKQSTGMLARIT